MDKKPHIKPYLYGMLAGFGAISLSIIFFFLIYRFDGFGDAISTLTGILMPFIYGAVIAYLLKPVCNTIESFLRRFIPEKMHGLVNVLSITLTILFGLLLIYALCMMIIPQLITSVTTLYYTAQRNLAKFVQWANHVEFIENNQQIMDMLNSAYATISTNIDDLIKTRLLPSMQNIVSGAAVGVLNVVTMAKNLIIGIIVAVYMLASRKRFVQQAKLVLYSIFKPRWAELIKEEVKYADKMFGGFINGKIMDSAIIGVLCYIGMNLLSMPYILLISVIIGVTNVIPFFGPYLGAIPSIFLILLVDPLQAVYFAIFILALQQFDGNILGPKILGESTGLSSFLVIVAILIGGGIFGIPGMIIGVPVFAVLYAALDKLVHFSLVYKKVPDQEQTYVNIDCLDPETHEPVLFPEEEPKQAQTPRRTAMLEFTLTLLKTIQKILITIWTFIKKYSLIIYAKVRQLIEEYKQKKNIKKDGQ